MCPLYRKEELGGFPSCPLKIVAELMVSSFLDQMISN